MADPAVAEAQATVGEEFSDFWPRRSKRTVHADLHRSNKFLRATVPGESPGRPERHGATARARARAGALCRAGEGKATPGACVDETLHRVRTGASRPGRENGGDGTERRDGTSATEAAGASRREPGRDESRRGRWTGRAGSAGGARNPREGGPQRASGDVSRTREADGEAGEVLEGERKARSGEGPDGKPPGGPRDGRRQGPRRETPGRRRSREAQRPATFRGQTLEVDATPRGAGP
jgi:hypothetical protein